MSTMHSTFPTRYEYFEAWLTPEEWATWKRYTHLPSSRRKEYLNEQIDFDNMLESEVEDEFRDMINAYLDWSDTPQGNAHWNDVWYSRQRPIRTL